MEELTDYTNTKPNPHDHIVLCPQCNRPGLLRYYPKETFGMVIHKTEKANMYNKVIDNCTITHDQARNLYVH